MTTSRSTKSCRTRRRAPAITLFVHIEKRGMTTPAAAQALARALGVRERDLGIAGMKDRHA